MQIQLVNNHAKKKYDELRYAIEMVRMALEEAEKLHSKIKKPASSAGWRVPTKEDVSSAHRKATEQLNTVRESTKKWEKELVSKGWRV